MTCLQIWKTPTLLSLSVCGAGNIQCMLLYPDVKTAAFIYPGNQNKLLASIASTVHGIALSRTLVGCLFMVDLLVFVFHFVSFAHLHFD